MSETLFKPEHLRKWTLPANYAGASWPDYYSFLGQHRDSDCLARSNFDAGLKAIGGECTDPSREDPEDSGAALSLVVIVRENHWAVGWVEWIAIHESAVEQLQIADKIKGELEDYPVVDEELFSQYETDEANQIWKDCYHVRERVEYIRRHKSQFEFRDWRDLLACCRGKYFAGYPSELIG